MIPTSNSPGQTRRNYQMDLMRICLATCVLLSHAVEITDGNRSREILCRLTHSNMTFGKLGVDGFFILSGYLIVQSWQRTPKVFNFLRNRVLRIVPGYLVAALLSTLVVGLLAPGVPHFFRQLSAHFYKGMLLLAPPLTPPVFPGLKYNQVNESMWTISYEFRCYLYVMICGLLGVLRRPFVVALCTCAFLVAMVIPWLPAHLPWPNSFLLLFGDCDSFLRFTAIYGVGACYALFRGKIPFRYEFALAATALLLMVRLVNPAYTELVIVLAGAYLIFYLSQLQMDSLSWMKKVPDISYGIYLYGWPVEGLWIWYRHGSPWVTFFVSTVMCVALGSLSWHLVEKPMLSLKKRARPNVAVPVVRDEVPAIPS